MRILSHAEPGAARGALRSLGPLLVGLLLSSSCRGPQVLPPPQLKLLDRSVSMPYRDTGVPLVEVSFPGAVSGWFILDSGSSHSLIDETFALEAGFCPEAFGVPLSTTRDGEVIAQLDRFVRIRELQVGGALVENLHAPLVNLRQVPGLPDGLIGQDLLAHWTILFTPASRTLHLCPDASTARRLMGPLDESARRISTSRAHRGVPVFDWELDGIQVSTVVDTGATHCALPRSVLEHLGSAPVESGRWVGLEGPQDCSVHELLPESLGLRNGSGLTRVVDGLGARVGFTLLADDAFVLDGPGEALWILVTQPTAVSGG